MNRQLLSRSVVKLRKEKKTVVILIKKIIIQVIVTSQFKTCINDFVFVLTRERQRSFDNCFDTYLSMY